MLTTPPIDQITKVMFAQVDHEVYALTHLPPLAPPAPPKPVIPAVPTGGPSDVPGVPQAFAACVAFRESTNGTNPAANGNMYGIIPASGYNVAGMSLGQQKIIFAKLYAQYGTQPWSPSDGC